MLYKMWEKAINLSIYTRSLPEKGQTKLFPLDFLVTLVKIYLGLT